MGNMNETMMVAIIAILIVIFIGLWVLSNRQKRKFEDAQRARKQELAELKAKAARKSEQDG